MIIPEGALEIPGDGGTTKDAFLDLPGLAVILGAMWLTNLGYWGFNQYIIQKGLAAKNISEAKKGLIFAGYLKILIPLIVVIPGITAYVLTHHYSVEELSVILGKPAEAIGAIERSDEAYPWLLKNFVPAGVKGLAFAALAAAIVSSLAAMINSTSTIFALDIYTKYFKPTATSSDQVRVGRIVAVVALGIAMFVAPGLQTLDQVFQYIQEYTGFIYPGVIVVFGMGLFWKLATANAALWTAIFTIPAGIFVKWMYPDMPFILRMGYVFIFLCFIASVISFAERGKMIKEPHPEKVNRRGIINASYILFALSLITLVVGVLFAKPYAHLALESIFVLTVLFFMIGMILYTNAKVEVTDKRALESDPALFSTSNTFNFGAAGIILIVIILYYFFW